MENLDIDQIKKYYKDFFNSGQVSLLSKFSFSKEIITSALGCYIFTKSGKKIFDMTSGFGTQNLGYNNPTINEIRIQYLKDNRLPFSRLFFDENIARLSKKIAEMLPDSLQYSFFANSGAEANEGAIKLAYKYYGGTRNLLLHNKNSFHGKLIATSQITDSPEVYFDFQKSLKTLKLDFFDLATFEETLEEHGNKIYAVILEPFSASKVEYFDYTHLLKILELCKKYKIVTIFDEVYSGFFRTGDLFYFMGDEEVVPDIITYSKSFGGGIASISGYTTKKDIFNQAYGKQKDALLHSSTYSNYIEECAIALKTLEIYSSETFTLQIKNNAKKLQKELNKLNDIKNIEHIKGRGFHYGIKLKHIKFSNIQPLLNLIPLEITSDPRFIEKLQISSIINELYHSHNILSYAGFNDEIKLIISPPVITTNEEIEYIVNALREVLSQKNISLVSKFVKNFLVN